MGLLCRGSLVIATVAVAEDLVVGVVVMAEAVAMAVAVVMADAVAEDEEVEVVVDMVVETNIKNWEKLDRRAI